MTARRIDAPETAALLASPDEPIPVTLTSAEARAYERHVAAIASAIGRRAARVRKLRADLRREETELRQIRRDLKLLISIRRPA